MRFRQQVLVSALAGSAFVGTSALMLHFLKENAATTGAAMPQPLTGLAVALMLPASALLLFGVVMRPLQRLIWLKVMRLEARANPKVAYIYLGNPTAVIWYWWLWITPDGEDRDA